MRKLIIPAVALASLGGCTVPMVCGPESPNGYRRCDPVAYTQPAPAVNYSYIPEPGPGYAPPYPPYLPYRPPVPHRRHEWVMDTPHWEPGDE